MGFLSSLVSGTIIKGVVDKIAEAKQKKNRGSGTYVALHKKHGFVRKPEYTYSCNGQEYRIRFFYGAIQVLDPNKNVACEFSYNTKGLIHSVYTVFITVPHVKERTFTLSSRKNDATDYYYTISGRDKSMSVYKNQTELAFRISLTDDGSEAVYYNVPPGLVFALLYYTTEGVINLDPGYEAAAYYENTM